MASHKRKLCKLFYYINIVLSPLVSILQKEPNIVSDVVTGLPVSHGVFNCFVSMWLIFGVWVSFTVYICVIIVCIMASLYFIFWFEILDLSVVARLIN